MRSACCLPAHPALERGTPACSYPLLRPHARERVAATDAGPLSRARTVVFQPRERCPTSTRGPLPRLNLVLPARPRELGPASFSMQPTISSSNYEEEPTNNVFIMQRAPTQFPLPLMTSPQSSSFNYNQACPQIPGFHVGASCTHTYLNWYY